MATDISSSFKSSEIVPDVVNTPPKELLSVTYNDRPVEFSMELTPTQVKDAPAVTWSPEASTFYTLCMTDPDATSRKNPILREVLHWLVTNIPGNDVSQGENLAEYRGSGPPEGSGLHRYVFLLYKQPGKLSFDGEKRISNRSRDGRLKFSIRKFADKYGLGEPIAGNMYQAQYDDYVPMLHAQYTD
ncbi:protein D2-like [Nasonia vitripennis]|uniref:Uncharacterized protein n=1 Tax=Nasonia vitripennis TaxID=7425 RepID=A0A7M7GAA7_NASVI|nr:protein D2-like [Nasonia vitripennis]